MRVRKSPNHDQGTITREDLEKKEQVDLGTVDLPGKGCGVLAARPFLRMTLFANNFEEMAAF